VRLRTSYADAYTGMGVSLKELKRKEEAEQCFAQVVRLRPNCALSLGNLAGDCLSCAYAFIILSQHITCVFIIFLNLSQTLSLPLPTGCVSIHCMNVCIVQYCSDKN